MNVYLFRLLTTIIALLLVAASIACAGTKPQVTRADGIFMDSGVSFRIQWESSEPVARVHISMGGERKSIDVDFRDNRRNPNGYSGEATALVPVPGVAITAFTVQIEDEFRIKSDILNGVITGNRPAFPPGMQPDDGWGQQNLTRPGGTAPGGMQQQGGFPPPMAPGMMPPPMMNPGMMPPPMMPPPQPGMMPPPMMPPPQPGMMPPPMMPPPQPGMMPPPQPGMMPPPMMPPPQPGMPMDPGMMQPGMMPQQQPGMMPPPQPGMPMDQGMIPPPPPPPPMQ